MKRDCKDTTIILRFRRFQEKVFPPPRRHRPVSALPPDIPLLPRCPSAAPTSFSRHPSAALPPFLPLLSRCPSAAPTSFSRHPSAALPPDIVPRTGIHGAPQNTLMENVLQTIPWKPVAHPKRGASSGGQGAVASLLGTKKPEGLPVRRTRKHGGGNAADVPRKKMRQTAPKKQQKTRPRNDTTGLQAISLQGCWNEYVMTISQEGRSPWGYNSPDTMSLMRFVSVHPHHVVWRPVPVPVGRPYPEHCFYK